MSDYFAWLLDARLHLILIASAVAAVFGRGGPTLEAAPDSPFNGATLVIYRDGTTSDDLAANPEKWASVTDPEGEASATASDAR